MPCSNIKGSWFLAIDLSLHPIGSACTESPR
jgi:hypothetical protein